MKVNRLTPVLVLTLGLCLLADVESHYAPIKELVPLQGSIHLNRSCLLCKFTMKMVQYSLQTKRGHDEVIKIAQNFCSTTEIQSPLVCTNVTKLFSKEFVKVLAYGILTPNQICGYLSNNTCGHFHDRFEEWEVDLNTSLVLNQRELALLEAAEGKKSKRNLDPFRVIHISDTHVDLLYKEGSPSSCLDPLCCRANSTAKSPAEPAGYWGSYGHCDVPLRTLESSLKAVNSTLQKSSDIKYIIWTGDIQPHDVWMQSKNSAIKTYDQVFEMIFKYLPNIKILPTLGNHEMVPVDSFSPSNLLHIAKEDSPVWLYKKLDSFWSRWLPADTEATIIRDGFYSIRMDDKLRVVSLNTNFCHTSNFWLLIDSVDPGKQLKWLVHELQVAELLHEKVHIIGHIPPGSDDCLKVWSKNYNRILRRFAATVTGQFFGHTHTNEFEVFYTPNQRRSILKEVLINNGVKGVPMKNNDKWTPISVGFIGPSVTTFVGLNPSFRIYNIEPAKGFMPTDFETYYMNLTLANMQGEKMEPKWQSAGLFSNRFGLDSTSPESMHKLLIELADNLEHPKSDDGPSITKSPNTLDVALAKNETELEKSADKGNDDGDDDDSDDDEDNVVKDGPDDDVEDDDDDDDTPTGLDGRLYELYRLFNSYSDKFDRTTYKNISTTDRAKFVCRFFTGQAHNFSVCDEYIPRGSGTVKLLQV